MAKIGRKKIRQPPSDSQLRRRGLFSYAQRYAGRVLADPVQAEHYEQRAKPLGKSAHLLLVANYLTPPQIDRVELGNYAGNAGAEIAILASDAIAVARVEVAIRGVDGATFESGAASEVHGVWRYRTQTAVPAGLAWRVEVTVKNRAEHAAIQTLPDPRNPAAGVMESRTRLPPNVADLSFRALLAAADPTNRYPTRTRAKSQ